MKRTLRLALIWLSIAAPALASEQSERLYSRGLVDFHAGRYSEALLRFEQAVQADHNDAYALYYLGVTQGRLGNFAAAVSDLRAALSHKPDLPRAPLELGAALVQSGQPAEAVAWLEQAQRSPETEAEASLFLGIAKLRLGELDPARQQFVRAAARDAKVATAARYYQGVADYREGRLPSAREHFTQVAADSPDSALGREAAAYLARLRSSEPPRFSFFGGLGFQYDSNVVLAPSDDAIKSQAGISNQSDGAALFQLGGRYVPWRNDTTTFTVGYDFFQSLYFDLDEFDLQDHGVSAQIDTKAGPVQLGMLGRYDYDFLQADSFLQEATVLPWVAIPESELGRTEIFYRMRRNDFFKRPYSPVNDSFNHAAGFRQYGYLGDAGRFVFLGYRFDRQDPINAVGNQFGYDGNEVSVGSGWDFAGGTAAEAAYAYRHESYDDASLGRRDNQHDITVAIHHDLMSHVRVTGAYFGTINNSNQAAFEYDRNIGSIAVELSF